MISSGLDFSAAEWVPNVTHDERKALEDEAQAYYEENDHGFIYKGGFYGFEPDTNSSLPGALSLQSRSEQPFYFPILFSAPAAWGAIHLDLYSIKYEKPIINMALEKVIPMLTPPFFLSGDPEGLNGYAVVLYHPGKPLTLPNQTLPRDLAALVIHVNKLLERAAKGQVVSLASYLFDSTLSSKDTQISPEFMGGIKIDVGLPSLIGSQDPTLSTYKGVKFEDLKQQHNPSLFFHQDILVGERILTVVVVPVDGSYEPVLTTVIATGVLIFVASLLLCLWMIHNMHRSIKMHRIMSEAAAEAAIVSNLFPANVRERMIQDAKDNANRAGLTGKDIFLKDGSGEHRLSKRRLDSILTSEGIFGSKPIAGL